MLAMFTCLLLLFFVVVLFELESKIERATLKMQKFQQFLCEKLKTIVQGFLVKNCGQLYKL